MDKADARQWVFVDEMGSHLGLTRLYARAVPGERVPEGRPADHQGNLSTIGAVGLTGIRTALSVPGAIDRETMLFFVEEMLAPTLRRGDFVFFDNCQIHKAEEIEEAIERRGAWAIFLPPYSPDFNPIENCWSKVKSILRSLKPRTLDDLLDALTEAFAAITKHDLLGWFRHCGYRVART
jgi:transposase